MRVKKYFATKYTKIARNEFEQNEKEITLTMFSPLF